MSVPNITIKESLVENKLAVSFKVILGLYFIIPLCILIYLLDNFFLDGQIKAALPTSQSHYLVAQILFGTPHILASTIILTSNKEYLKFFRPKLIFMTLLIGLVYGVGSYYIPYVALYVATACWTVYHVFKQQHGIAKSVCRLPSWAFYWLLWLSVSAGICIYMGIFLRNSLDPKIVFWINLTAGTLTIGLILSSVLLQRYVYTLFGKCFLWANTLLIVSSFFLNTQGYYFLAILIPRLVHDATAYVFYLAHDYNKHHQQPENLIYKVANRCNLNVFLVLPLASFLLTYILQAHGNEWFNIMAQFFFGVEIRKAITLVVIGYFSLMHYYTESFIWQVNSPLRRYIRFSK